MTDRQDSISRALESVELKRHDLSIFMEGVAKWFAVHPKLNGPGLPVAHSVKMRLKGQENLRRKLNKKWDDGEKIDADNVHEKITDLAGVRVLHLYQEQFLIIHQEILTKVNVLGDWHLAERPKAYTWDPESKAFFEGAGIDVNVKESFYTSVHYLLKPREDSPLCCEVQVRTLFEEIWGEVDHTLNYPVASDNLACREQLRVLAKLVGAGSRLVDSVFRIAN
jgi:ppGpp synthetase/RelA/SpoT-type nucleotidyltranferase